MCIGEHQYDLDLIEYEIDGIQDIRDAIDEKHGKVGDLMDLDLPIGFDIHQMPVGAKLIRINHERPE